MATPTGRINIDEKSEKNASSPDPSDMAFVFPQPTSLVCIPLNQDHTIVGWNSAATSLLGWQSGDMIGHPIEKLFAKECLDDAAVLAATSLVEMDTHFETKEGTQLAIRLWKSHMGDQATPFAFVQDRTEEKFLETAFLKAAEREQYRIGQELHDHLCQHLVGAAFATKALAGALTKENSPHAAALHDLARLVNDSVLQVREVSRGLHPVELDADGLTVALQDLAARASRVVPCEVKCSQKILITDPKRALHAYRIAQEAVSSGLHSNAKKISISLSETSGNISLTIQDDGPIEGELTADPLGTGARTLHYRARELGGTLSVTFLPEQGTILHCSFPNHEQLKKS